MLPNIYVPYMLGYTLICVGLHLYMLGICVGWNNIYVG